MYAALFSQSKGGFSNKTCNLSHKNLTYKHPTRKPLVQRSSQRKGPLHKGGLCIVDTSISAAAWSRLAHDAGQTVASQHMKDDRIPGQLFSFGGQEEERAWTNHQSQTYSCTCHPTALLSHEVPRRCFTPVIHGGPNRVSILNDPALS